MYIQILVAGLALFFAACGDNIKPAGPPEADADLTGPVGPIGPAGPQGPAGPEGECQCYVPPVTEACAARNHALWFSSALGKDFFFVSGGELAEQEDGSLRLTGVAARESNHSKAFRVDVTFSALAPGVPPGSPKHPPACADLTDWVYYEVVEGTLEGMGQWAGALLVIEGRGAAAQLGTGAAIHSCEVGLATWFTYYTVVNPCDLPDSGVGDININLGAACLADEPR